MTDRRVIASPDDPLLAELCRELALRADALDASADWPAEQLAACARAGVFEWFLPRRWGGQEWSEADLLRAYLRLSGACLTTTFIITQWAGAARRIAASDNPRPAERWLPGLVSGEAFATVGISHLTTSRRHLGRPALAARARDGGLVLDGYSPWVTGGGHAQVIVAGATLDDGRQVLVALPTDLAGVSAREPARLLALSASHTCEVHCRDVWVPDEALLAGPAENVMRTLGGGATGGLQTSALALGLAGAAVEFLESEAAARGELRAAAESLAAERRQLEAEVTAVAEGNASCSQDELRTRANSLVLRATQAALAAAKGAGYVSGHPAGRWCREAMFFLVWSCPQPVVAANLCELAGL
jgi:alkylation response protein AidB-like acyl-CoA dehydrogenase